jgi:hypothetical protein
MTEVLQHASYNRMRDKQDNAAVYELPQHEEYAGSAPPNGSPRKAFTTGPVKNSCEQDAG